MRVVIALVCLLMPGMAWSSGKNDVFTLDEVIAYGMENSAVVRSAQADVAAESTGVRAAEAARMPKFDLQGGVTKYSYPSPVTPIAGSPTAGLAFPEFDRTIYNAGLTFNLPLFQGGRLIRGVTIAKLRRSIAEDTFLMSRQDLIYNLTSTYYKILQLDKMLQAHEASVRQLEAHKRDVEVALVAGTVAKVQLLKAETELAHARQAALISKNNLESAYELLKALMGIEDSNRSITVIEAPQAHDPHLSLEESMPLALRQRHDYQASRKKLEMHEERVKRTEGKKLPSLSVTGEYADTAGTDLELNENWAIGLRLTIPLFDGGAVAAEIGREKAELLKAKENERALRIDIFREVRIAHLSIENAADRIDAAGTSIESAKENLRIERLKYKAGGGTSTDVIDAQEALLRAETDYYQALFDKKIALASLRKAIGKEFIGEEGEK
ncbi:MAG: hypothetical protein A2X56_10240 [Nitrospirae bacterium GWC2_57_13]|nr:MAG: hypothetical protein A2072_02000 [Nitrospirae bacterium GWC1_57_7]OGW26751.1 MAG: hypothetical protein A2X56_10240 [Nitrospirae bacterium GWC2_57_13]